MKKYIRKTTQERIDLLNDELRKLKRKQKEEQISQRNKLNKDSDGVQEAIDALTNVVKLNKSSMGEVIKLISSVKRTGLRIQDPVKKKETSEQDEIRENESSSR